MTQTQRTPGLWLIREGDRMLALSNQEVAMVVRAVLAEMDKPRVKEGE